jgi:hypothetical protein
MTRIDGDALARSNGRMAEGTSHVPAPARRENAHGCGRGCPSSIANDRNFGLSTGLKRKAA